MMSPYAQKMIMSDSRSFLENRFQLMQGSGCVWEKTGHCILRARGSEVGYLHLIEDPKQSSAEKT